MSTVGSTGAVSSTAQQDRVASGNSQQARRSSGDSRVFANMLAAASEQSTPDVATDKLTETLVQARKKDAGKNADLSSDQNTGHASHPTDSTALARLVGNADTRPAQDTPQATEEQGQSPRRAAQGGRPQSTLSLVTRDAAHPQRALATAAQTAQSNTDGAANPGAAAAGAAALNPAADPAAGHNKALTDSQGAAFAAALEDALDVSDDVTLTATVSTDLRSSASDGPDAAVGALAQAESRDSEALTGTEAPQNAAADATAEAFQNTWADAMDRVGQQVSYWLGKGVSQAQLTVHGGQGESVDVRVLLRGGQAHLEFLSNHEATREAIAQHGAEALRTVLGDSGLDLASLRVDAQAHHNENMGQSAGQNNSQNTRNLATDGLTGADQESEADQNQPALATSRSAGWATTALLDTFA